MNATKSPPNKRKLTAFQPSPSNLKRIELAQSIGLNVSAIINQSLEERFEAVMQEKARQVEKALKVVRGAGFEPATPTVSR